MWQGARTLHSVNHEWKFTNLNPLNRSRLGKVIFWLFYDRMCVFRKPGQFPNCWTRDIGTVKTITCLGTPGGRRGCLSPCSWPQGVPRDHRGFRSFLACVVKLIFKDLSPSPPLPRPFSYRTHHLRLNNTNLSRGLTGWLINRFWQTRAKITKLW